jgi:hypothetical protein
MRGLSKYRSRCHDGSHTPDVISLFVCKLSQISEINLGGESVGAKC